MKLFKFPKKLKELMEKNDLTQKELAEKLKTTQQTISRWLKGENEPNLHTLVLLCYILKTTPNYILGYDEDDDFTPFGVELEIEPFEDENGKIIENNPKIMLIPKKLK